MDILLIVFATISIRKMNVSQMTTPGNPQRQSFQVHNRKLKVELAQAETGQQTSDKIYAYCKF